MEVKKIIKWRNIWMGIAMLWIVWYHSGLMVEGTIVTFLRGVGYGGVDIFLFASGLGCYFSLDKDSDFANFIKRRISRIIPTYWLFLIIWTVFRSMTTGISRKAILGNFLCIQSFTGLGSDFNWYISAMWLLYFLAPFFYSGIKKYASLKQYAGMFLLILLMTVPFWTSATYIIMVTRIPIFYLGMLLGKMAKEDMLLEKVHIGILTLLMIAGIGMLYFFSQIYVEISWSHGFYWYPFIFIVPGLCVLISCLMEKITNFKVGKWVEKGLNVVGTYSFEVYLVHALINEIYRAFFVPVDPKYSENGYWYLVILSVIPGCILFVGLNKGLNQIGKKLFHK